MTSGYQDDLRALGPYLLEVLGIEGQKPLYARFGRCFFYTLTAPRANNKVVGCKVLIPNLLLILTRILSRTPLLEVKTQGTGCAPYAFVDEIRLFLQRRHLKVA